jgi:hypothetical protein
MKDYIRTKGHNNINHIEKAMQYYIQLMSCFKSPGTYSRKINKANVLEQERKTFLHVLRALKFWL